jgi:hypothetical protein
MKKGIVMDIDDKFLTLLTPDGQFLRAKKQKRTCVLGEEITFTPFTKLKPTIGIKSLAVAAAVLLILLGSLLPLHQNNQAYAYMSIDANPSIELAINKKMQVVKLTPYNQDGKKIAAKIAVWEKKDVAAIFQTIIKEMKKQGYLKKNHTVIISAVRAENPEEKTDIQLKKNIKEIKDMVKEINVKPVVINGSEKDLEKAHQEGITTGKYREKLLHSKIDSTPKPNTKKDDGMSPEDNKSVSGTDSAVSNENHPPENNGQAIDPPASSEPHNPPGELKKLEEPSQQIKKEEKSNPRSNYGQMKKQEKQEKNDNQKK